jgi:hypothetical protein
MSDYSSLQLLSPTIIVHTVDSGQPGPTALIQAGIHGDEIAGVHALEELLEARFMPDAGRLVIIPVMNPAAYRAQKRMAPGGLDLNRCFPGDANAQEPERRLAHQFMELYAREKPSLVVTLHESWKRYHPEVPASFGQTLVYGVKPMPPLVQTVMDKMNTQTEHPYELWAPHYYPVSTSSTELIVERFGCIGLTVETWMGFELPRRVTMQKQVVKLLLEEVGVLKRAS